MVRFRYTIEELQKWTDYELLQRIVTERHSDCTNIYSPLAKRLTALHTKLEQKQDLTK